MCLCVGCVTFEHLTRIDQSYSVNQASAVIKHCFYPSRLTLVCLNCDLLVDATGGDLMSKHLTDRPNHVCKIIQEKGIDFSSHPTSVIARIVFSKFLRNFCLVFDPADGKAKEPLWVANTIHIILSIYDPYLHDDLWSTCKSTPIKWL